MMFGMLAGGGLVLALAIWGLAALFPSARRGDSPLALQSPLEILNARYAGGEIGRGEYETVKAELSSKEALR